MRLGHVLVLLGLIACEDVERPGESLPGAVNGFGCPAQSEPVGGQVVDLERRCVTGEVYQTGCLAPGTICTQAFACFVNADGLAVIRPDGCAGTGGDSWSSCPGS